jgi:hypothetical protein
MAAVIRLATTDEAMFAKVFREVEPTCLAISLVLFHVVSLWIFFKNS